MKLVRWVAVSCTLVASAASQTVSGPVFGWTLDTAGRGVQAILGVPGASQLGPLAGLPGDVRSAKLNPGRSLALALAGDAGIPVVLNLETLARTDLAQAGANPDLAVWSPSGTALALLYRAEQKTQVFTLQAGSFQYSGEVYASADQAAVSDDGSALLGASASGLALYRNGGAAVLTPIPTGSFTFLAGTTSPAFWAGGRLAAGGQDLPFEARDGEAVYMASPAAGRLVAVRAGEGRVTTFDGNGQQIDDAVCHCVVQGIEALGAAGAIRLDTGGEGPLWVAGSAGDTRLFFVPAAGGRKPGIKGGR
jgi:hypothetical protein